MFTENNNILVLIQLIGGNDSLSTIMPLDAYEVLHGHRQNILIPENQLLRTKDGLGFHPAIPGLFDCYNNGELCIVNNVGYPLPNRSHFRSMDIWNSGSPSTEQWNSGWLGRLMDVYHTQYPGGYPNDLFSDPLAITLGNIVSDTCQGKAYNYSHVVDDLTTFMEISTCKLSTVKNKAYSEMLGYLDATITLSNLYTEHVKKAAGKGRSLIQYPDKNQLAQELKIVAQLISGGLKTKIYVLSLGGFDTHAYQTGKHDPMTGFHAERLQTLSVAIDCFVKDMKQLGCYDKVSLMTYSEFGRQIKSNSAFGTDHGDATSLFMIGKNIQQQVLGAHPVIEKEIDKQQALEMQIDFRDLYSSVLNQWFAIPKDKMPGLFKMESRFYDVFKV